MEKIIASLSVFQHSPFRWSLLGRLLGTLASMMGGVTIGWQVYTIARETMSIAESSFMVGMVGLAQFVPMFLLALYAGAIIDRYNRRLIVLLTTASQGLLLGGLALIALLPHPSLLMIFIVAGLTGVPRAFGRPSLVAMTAMLIPKDILPRTIAWNSLSLQMGMVVGPWMGGALCAQSVFLSYAVSAAIVVCAVVAFFMVRGDTNPQASSQKNIAFILEGLRYIWGNKIVFGAISLDLFATLFGGVTALLPVYARDILHVGADGFGMLRAAAAIGGGGMALLLAIHPIQRRTGVWLLSSVTAYGVFTIIFAVSRDMTLSMLALILLGASDAISVYVRQSLVQVVTPDPMRGRVSSVSTLFISASNELGEFESGVAARLMGPMGSALFGGIASIVVVLLWSKLFPALRKADRFEMPEF